MRAHSTILQKMVGVGLATLYVLRWFRFWLFK